MRRLWRWLVRLFRAAWLPADRPGFIARGNISRGAAVCLNDDGTISSLEPIGATWLGVGDLRFDGYDPPTRNDDGSYNVTYHFTMNPAVALPPEPMTTDELRRLLSGPGDGAETEIPRFNSEGGIAS